MILGQIQIWVEKLRNNTLDNLLINISVENKWIKGEIAQIIGRTVAYDFPNLHPEFISILTVNGLGSWDIERVKGSLMSLISSFQLCDDRLHTLIPDILPSLYECFCNNGDLWIKERWFKLYTLCLQTWLWMEEVDPELLK